MKNKTITEAELINILKVTEPTFARMRSKLQPKNAMKMVQSCTVA